MVEAAAAVSLVSDDSMAPLLLLGGSVASLFLQVQVELIVSECCRVSWTLVMICCLSADEQIESYPSESVKKIHLRCSQSSGAFCR